MAAPALVLASRSPQRSAILAQLGVIFTVRPAGVAELTDGEPERVALENARRKATAVRAAAREERLVLGADTIVVLDGVIHGKPPDAAAARKVLRILSGRTHTVLTGLCVLGPGATRERATVASTEVRFRPLTAELLDWYVAGGEWRERAGGYAVQGRGAAFVHEVHGDYTNVVGLPVAALIDLVPELLPGAHPDLDRRG